MKSVLGICGAAVAALVLYLATWPVPIDPAPWSPPASPGLVGPYATNTALAGVTRLSLGDGIGPEDVMLGPDGRLYTGLLDGRIVRMQPDGSGLEVFAETGGRPQSMEFDAEGNLIVCDTWRGLLSIDAERTVTVLTRAAEGVPFMFTNDLHIASYGTIYFTDASSKFNNDQDIEALLEHGGHGRLLSYVPARRETRVLLSGLQFANGVTMDPEERYLLVNETGAYRTLRLWLMGEQAGTVETFIDNLPGFPDNISCNGRDTFWLAIPSPRDPQVDAWLAPSRFLRKVVMRLPKGMRPAAQHHAFVLGFDFDGNVVHNLQDPAPDCFWYITSVNEFDGRLYLGSLAEGAIATLPAPTMAEAPPPAAASAAEAAEDATEVPVPVEPPPGTPDADPETDATAA